MHGLNIIKRLNDQEQRFIDHVLNKSRPPEQNLLEVWRDFKRQEELSKLVEEHPNHIHLEQC